MDLRILVLPGDGIGPEVTAEAVAVLQRVADRFGHPLQIDRRPHRRRGHRAGRRRRCRARRARPRRRRTRRCWAPSACPVSTPAAGSAARARPARAAAGARHVRQPPARRARGPSLLDASPLKNAIVEGTDLLFVRELTSGLYYGTPRGISGSGADERAVNTLSYTRAEIERVAHVAFELAARPASPRDERGQVERARELAAVAPRGHRRSRPATPTSRSTTCSWTTARCRSSSTRAASTSCSPRTCSATS